MATKEVKLPQRGAVAKITEERKKLRKQPASPGLRDVFHKETEPHALPERKIASPSGKPESDLGL